MSTVVVIDYGASNLRSVAKALGFVADKKYMAFAPGLIAKTIEFVAGKKYKVIVSDQPEQILAADRVVFPGQGAIGQCMTSIKEKGLGELITETIKTKPFLGICLGLQSLMDMSDEDGGTQGLGIIPGRVIRFKDHVKDDKGDICKIPHMGWNQVVQSRPHALWKGINNGARFYFVHSYYVDPENQSDIAATTDYAASFTSAAARDNIFATQFHPEKSQKAGLTLLKNFLEWKI